MRTNYTRFCQYWSISDSSHLKVPLENSEVKQIMVDLLREGSDVLVVGVEGTGMAEDHVR
jgi:hypothetical protein